jgi:hypothetical protein
MVRKAPLARSYLGWIIAEKTNGVIYPTSKHLRIELLDTIEAETVTAFESSRQTAERTAA